MNLEIKRKERYTIATNHTMVTALCLLVLSPLRQGQCKRVRTVIGGLDRVASEVNRASD